MLTDRVTQMKLKQMYSFHQYPLKCDVNQLEATVSTEQAHSTRIKAYVDSHLCDPGLATDQEYVWCWRSC